jgi:hypothetical protein
MTTSQEVSRDKQEIDALTNAFFRAVSFSEGDRPAYHTLYQIFIESGQFLKTSTSSPEISTVKQFIEPRQQSVDTGELTRFREAETAEITEIFGNIAHRLSTYEKYGVSNGITVTGQGIISIQYIRTENGWRMSSMAWDDERPGLTIPDRYKSPTP